MANPTAALAIAGFLIALFLAFAAIYPFLLIHILTCLEDGIDESAVYEPVEASENPKAKPTQARVAGVTKTVGSTIRTLYSTNGISGLYRGLRPYAFYTFAYWIVSSFISAQLSESVPKSLSYPISSGTAGLLTLHLQAAATRDLSRMVIPTLLSHILALAPYNLLGNVVYEKVSHSPYLILLAVVCGYFATLVISIPVSVMLYHSHIGQMKAATIIHVDSCPSISVLGKVPFAKYMRIIMEQLFAIGWQIGCISIMVGLLVLLPTQQRELIPRVPLLEAY